MKTKVKQVDSLSFTIGVTVTYLVQWIVLMRPAMLKYFYYASMLILLPHRYIFVQCFDFTKVCLKAFHQKMWQRSHNVELRIGHESFLFLYSLMKNYTQGIYYSERLISRHTQTKSTIQEYENIS